MKRKYIQTSVIRTIFALSSSRTLYPSPISFSSASLASIMQEAFPKFIPLKMGDFAAREPQMIAYLRFKGWFTVVNDKYKRCWTCVSSTVS